MTQSYPERDRANRVVRRVPQRMTAAGASARRGRCTLPSNGKMPLLLVKKTSARELQKHLRNGAENAKIGA